jgi:hypothetical protein
MNTLGNAFFPKSSLQPRNQPLPESNIPQSNIPQPGRSLPVQPLLPIDDIRDQTKPFLELQPYNGDYDAADNIKLKIENGRIVKINNEDFSGSIIILINLKSNVIGYKLPTGSFIPFQNSPMERQIIKSWNSRQQTGNSSQYIEAQANKNLLKQQDRTLTSLQLAGREVGNRIRAERYERDTKIADNIVMKKWSMSPTFITQFAPLIFVALGGLAYLLLSNSPETPVLETKKEETKKEDVVKETINEIKKDILEDVKEDIKQELNE